MQRSIAAWKKRQGEYPENLGQLVPAILETGLPVDPFSGSSFQYRLAPGSKTYWLWSVGPDRKDDRLEVAYDASNGTVSRGDLSIGDER